MSLDFQVESRARGQHFCLRVIDLGRKWSSRDKALFYRIPISLSHTVRYALCIPYYLACARLDLSQLLSVLPVTGLIGGTG